MIAHAGDIGGVVGENLRAALDWLPQGKKLLTVRTDCTLPVAPTELVAQPVDAAKLRSLLERFEFKTWLKDVDDEGDAAMQPRATTPCGTRCVARPRRRARARRPSRTRRPHPMRAPVPRHYETVLDMPAFERLIDAIGHAELVCFDTETTSLDPMQARIVGLSFALEPGHAGYLPLVHRYAGAPQQLPLDLVLARLKPWFENPAKKKLGQNVKYDQHVLANHGIALAGVAHDTMLQSYVLESHRPHDMDSLALRHLDVKTLELCGRHRQGRIANQFRPGQRSRDATEYSAEDADVTRAAASGRSTRGSPPTRASISSIRRSRCRPAKCCFGWSAPACFSTAHCWTRKAASWASACLRSKQQAYELAGQPFNLGSPKQLGDILFGKMGLPVVKKTATGQPSTDEDVLQQLAADYPLPKLLLEHRGLSKLKSTYTDKLPQMRNAHTGRVHTSFGQATAVTGRLASTDPNLQNIPVRTPEGRRIREAFIAPPGHTIVSADYSQVELRIMAHLSGDESLLKAFAEGADIHRATAAEIFGVPLADVSGDQRRYIKAVNFGLIYGMSAFGLAAQLAIERSAAQMFIDKYFTRYPGVAEYMRRTRELAHKQGYVETVFGRRLWLPDINAGGGPRRQGAERAAINAPMQGTAADLIKLAMIVLQQWLDRERLGTRLILQVHDELVLEAPDAELDRVKRELPVLMSGVAQLRVPLVVDVGSGPNWEQAH